MDTPLDGVLRYAAFTATPDGGNPAGIVLDASRLDDAAMQGIATEVGYAETAFVIERIIGGDARRSRLRYFSPLAEVPFCGHATIATAVALAEREGEGAFHFDTPVGPIRIETTVEEGVMTASFTSVEPRAAELDDAVLGSLLRLLGVDRTALHPGYPPLLSYAGNWHPVVVFAEREAFDGFRFDPVALRALMDAEGWAGTVTTLRAIGPHEFEARNLFPVGAITEDPATGSAAASVGGYLRRLGLPPSTVVIHQGTHVGRPSVLTVTIPAEGGIVVSGSAVRLDPSS
ncbi:MAG: phenazine biosynthesis protein PhzF [Microbacteriaceae bacterium]|jgi:PhzF family phenazine biosynthesis protein|nr:phenazine biosynthesis protein PhzF [Microbacteriaceae bacterium]